MPRKPKATAPDASLAPIPSEILDQFVRQGPLTPEELDAAMRRFRGRGFRFAGHQHSSCYAPHTKFLTGSA